MRKIRFDYNIKFAQDVRRLRDAGLSINEIAFNDNHNPKHLTPQRISSIDAHYRRQLEAGRLPHA